MAFVKDRDVITDEIWAVIEPLLPAVLGAGHPDLLQIVISDTGRRTVEGQTQEKIANEMRPIMESVLDELDRWFSSSVLPAMARR
jgi:transposase